MHFEAGWAAIRFREPPGSETSVPGRIARHGKSLPPYRKGFCHYAARTCPATRSPFNVASPPPRSAASCVAPASAVGATCTPTAPRALRTCRSRRPRASGHQGHDPLWRGLPARRCAASASIPASRPCMSPSTITPGWLLHNCWPTRSPDHHRPPARCAGVPRPPWHRCARSAHR